MKIRLRGPEDTRQYGRTLGEAAKPGDVICLLGDLGTGKTTLTKAIAEGIGVTEEITSPTFTIVNVYRSGRLPLYHFDVYRMSGEEEFLATGADEYFDAGGLCVVEWAELIEEAIPEGAMVIEMHYGDTPEERLCEIGWI